MTMITMTLMTITIATIIYDDATNCAKCNHNTIVVRVNKNMGNISEKIKKKKKQSFVNISMILRRIQDLFTR